MKLEIKNLIKAFGGVRAIDDVSLAFPSGSLSAVIGPNGAGKTTFFNLISGAFTADAGEVLLDDQDVLTALQGRADASGHRTGLSGRKLLSDHDGAGEPDGHCDRACRPMGQSLPSLSVARHA